jgi:hypothetical protein
VNAPGIAGRLTVCPQGGTKDPLAKLLEVSMTSAFVVKTGEKFLCSAEDGDIGLAPEIKEARRFFSRGEAEKAADKYADPGYEIVPVELVER